MSIPSNPAAMTASSPGTHARSRSPVSVSSANAPEHADASLPPAPPPTARPSPVERRAVHKIRFAAAEWAQVEARARASGRAPACYVREVALGAVPKVSRTRANAPAIRELGALAAAVQRLRGTVAPSGNHGSAGPAPAPGAPGSRHEGAAIDAELGAILDGLLAVVRRLA